MRSFMEFNAFILSQLVYLVPSKTNPRPRQEPVSLSLEANPTKLAFPLIGIWQVWLANI